MPEVQLFLAAGRTNEQKKAVMKGISDAVVTHLGVSADVVTVQIIEAPLTDKMKGGQTFEERRASQPKP